MIFAERILKARIAETIASEMLKEAGYYVYRFGYEGVVQNLAQRGLPEMKKGDLEAQKVRSMPDFLVMDREGDVSFIEVKFRAKREMNGELRERFGRASKYWPEARLLIVYPSEPYFSVSTFLAFARTGKLYPLEQDRYLQVRNKLVKEYAEMVKKYLS